jgi:hypothetical protein
MLLIYLIFKHIYKMIKAKVGKSTTICILNTKRVRVLMLPFLKFIAQQAQVHLSLSWDSDHDSYSSNIEHFGPNLSSSLFPYYVYL